MHKQYMYMLCTWLKDHYPGPLKEGKTLKRNKISACDNDATASKPVATGRVVDDTQDRSSSKVTKCGNSRCKTCRHIVEGSSFSSNVTGKKYDVISDGMTMSCDTKNVIYLISCNKCGIQYIGETSQTLRSRINNHRNRLKNLCDLYLYQHFNSDDHSEDDILVMPIEAVSISKGECITLTAKRRHREDYWYRELKTIYPYGLNDNVKGVGNISKCRDRTLVIWKLFNRHMRKYRKRPAEARKRNGHRICNVETELKSMLSNYKSVGFLKR